jgi:hypothetical protein
MSTQTLQPFIWHTLELDKSVPVDFAKLTPTLLSAERQGRRLSVIRSDRAYTYCVLSKTVPPLRILCEESVVTPQIWSSSSSCSQVPSLAVHTRV